MPYTNHVFYAYLSIYILHDNHYSHIKNVMKLIGQTFDVCMHINFYMWHVILKNIFYLHQVLVKPIPKIVDFTSWSNPALVLLVLNILYKSRRVLVFCFLFPGDSGFVTEYDL